MASIAEWIQKIKTAIYGEEVRGAIWQSLQAMNDELTSADVTQIPKNKAAIETFQTDVTQAKDDVTTLKEVVADLKSDLTELGASLETYLPLTVIPAANTVASYSIDLRAETVLPVQLSITNGGQGGYYGYGLYQGDNLVWGVGVPDSDIPWIPAGTTRVLDIPSGIVADSLKIRNRNSRTGTTVTLTSNPISVLKDSLAMAGSEYDGTHVYTLGELCLHGGKLYVCTTTMTNAVADFNAGYFAEISIANLIETLHDDIFVKLESWEQGSVNYNGGALADNTSRTRTTELSGIAKVESKDQEFAVFGYYNGAYIGLYNSDTKQFEIPSALIQTKYADLTDFGIGYTFRIVNYATGDATASSRLIKILKQRYISASNLGVLTAVSDLAKENTVITVGTGKQYTSLRSALEYAKTIANDHHYVTVEWYSNGDYDVMNDISADDLADSTFIGLIVPAYTKLIGMNQYTKNVIKLTLPDSASEMSKINISTLNLQENAELENLTVYGKNCRYAIHDDTNSYNPAWKEKTIKKCHVISDYTYYNRAYGAGYRSGMKWVFEDCIFENKETDLGYAAFTAHNNNGFTKPSELVFKNCQFIGGYGAGFGSLNVEDSDIVNIIKMYGCKVTNTVQTWKVSLFNEGGDSKHGCQTSIIGCCNNFDNDDIAIRSNDALDWSDRKKMTLKISET